jgi:hypothetical protein
MNGKISLMTRGLQRKTQNISRLTSCRLVGHPEITFR